MLSNERFSSMRTTMWSMSLRVAMCAAYLPMPLCKRVARSPIILFARASSCGSPALCGLPVDLLENCVANLAGRHFFHAGLHDVAGAQPGIEHKFHRLVDEIGLFGEVEGIAQHHREGEHAGERVGDVLAGDVGRAAVDGLVERLAVARFLGRAARARPPPATRTHPP